jgi:Golgi nucleoside diphosphatase
MPLFDRNACCFLLAFVLVAIVPRLGMAIPTNAAKGTKSQIVVFDAGSSGTRVHVFDCYRDKRGSNPLPVVDLTAREKQTLKVKPGLSALAKTKDREGTVRAMKELLDFVNRFVPVSKRPATPLLLKATAGLRAVPADDSELVLSAVRDVFRKSDYKFVSEWAGIIPGNEEGGLSWVAANYLQGTFDAKATGRQDVHDSKSDSGSVGVIELGGGSIQVTAQIDAVRNIRPNDKFEFFIPGGRQYHVYAHSYMNYGQDYVQKTLVDSGKYGSKRLEGSSPAAPQGDPCYPTGYSRSWTVGACASSPGSDAAACTSAATQKVQGKGKFEGCTALAKQFLDDSTDVSTGLSRLLFSFLSFSLTFVP